MKKNLLLASAILLFGKFHAQTTIFEDSFESYTNFIISDLGSWTLRDLDTRTTYNFGYVTYPYSGAVKSFQVFNSTATTPPLSPNSTSDWSARTGTKMMIDFASGSSPWNNDWLISPSIQLLTTGNTLTFWGKSCDKQYGAEKFTVYISTTDTNISSFTPISENPVSSPADAAWHQYTYNLDSYAGQNVYIAIQCTSQNQFGFAIDDFKVVGSSVLATSEIKNISGVSIYPNPSTEFVTIKSLSKVSNIEVYDLSGKKINTSFKNDQVDIRNLEKGIYILKAQNKDGLISEKFIKK